jgi:hypothetical protein
MLEMRLKSTQPLRRFGHNLCCLNDQLFELLFGFFARNLVCRRRWGEVEFDETSSYIFRVMDSVTPKYSMHIIGPTDNVERRNAIS